MKHHMGRQVRYHAPPSERWGVVRHIGANGELQVEMLDASIVLNESDGDFVLSAWLRRYDADHEIVVGDTIIFGVMPSKRMVAKDVVTKREVTKGVRTHARVANTDTDAEHPDHDIPTNFGEITYLLDVHDSKGKKIGVSLVFDESSLHDGWDTRWKHNPDKPLFSEEGPDFYDAAYAHNAMFATSGPYQTPLSTKDEAAFRAWVAKWDIPFDPKARTVDYDMRGFWKAQPGHSASAPPHGDGDHFPDTWKTPYDTSFSAESMYATSDCPFVWQGNALVDTRTDTLVFGSRHSRRSYVQFPGNYPHTGFGATIGDIVTGYQVRDPHTDELIGYVPIYSGDEGGPHWAE